MLLDFGCDFGLSRSDSLAQVADVIRSNPRAFRRALFQACTEPRLGLSRVWSPSRAFSDSLERHLCDICGHSTSSRQSLAAHAFGKHGKCGSAYNHVVDGSCPCCLTDFHNRSRLLAHLQKQSRRCLAFVLQAIPPVDQDTLEQVVVEEATRVRSLARRGRDRDFAEEPAIRMQGPLCQRALELGVSFSKRLNTGGAPFQPRG